MEGSVGEVGALDDIDWLDHGFLGVVLRLKDDDDELAGDGGDRTHCQFCWF
jgi:hypothetical protein